MSAHTPQPGTRGAWIDHLEHYREKAKAQVHGANYTAQGLDLRSGEGSGESISYAEESDLEVPKTVPADYKRRPAEFYRKHAEFLANLCRLARIEKRQERKLSFAREEGWQKSQALLQEQIGELKVEIIHLRKTIHLLTK